MWRPPGVRILGLLVLVSGCGPAEPAKTTPPPDRPAETSPENPPSTKAAAETGEASSPNPGVFRSPATGLTFSIPAGWQEEPLSPFLAGIHEKKYRVPVGEQTAEATLSAARGGLELNVNRWVNQVEAPPGTEPIRRPIQVAGIESRYVELQGGYQPVGGAPRPDYRVIGVAIPGDGWDYYVKLLGPKEAVLESEDDFRKLLESARR